jgi:hypothetical protein
MNKKTLEDTLNGLSQASVAFNEAMDSVKLDREEFWNALSKDEQLKCFCAVVERIDEAEYAGKSYRGILYDVFAFGQESYASAQMSGFLSLHNAYYDGTRMESMLKDFATMAGVENVDEQVSKFMKTTY